jgi:hypothetical protein
MPEAERGHAEKQREDAEIHASSLPAPPGICRDRSNVSSDEMRMLAIVVFALAVTGATLAGSGLVVAPHIDPPGTPKYHAHVLAAYRLPIFLAAVQARLDPRQGVITEKELDVVALAFALALLVFAWPRFARPTLRGVDLPIARVSRAMWRAPLIIGPPRA